MKTFQIILVIISITTLLPLTAVNAADHIPVSDEFTDGEKFVNSHPKSDSVDYTSSVLPASKTTSAKPFPPQAATSGKPPKSAFIARSAVNKTSGGILSRIFSSLKPTQKDLENSFNDDVVMGMSNSR